MYSCPPIKSIIAKGAFGEVCELSSGDAIKKIKKMRYVRDRVSIGIEPIVEINIMSYLFYHLLPLKEFVSIPCGIETNSFRTGLDSFPSPRDPSPISESEIGLMMPLCEGLAHTEMFSRLTYVARKDSLFHLAMALYQLHSMGYLHLDIKEGNLLCLRSGEISNLDIILSDYGFAIYSKELLFNQTAIITLPTLRTTLNYRSPELLEAEKKESKMFQYSVKTDVWSLGIIFLEILSNVKTKSFRDDGCFDQYLTYFNETFNFKSIRNILFSREKTSLNGHSGALIPDYEIDDATDLLLKMLSINPRYRCTMTDVINHPYFKESTCSVKMNPIHGSRVQPLFRIDLMYEDRLRGSVEYLRSVVLTKYPRENAGVWFTCIDCFWRYVSTCEELPSGSEFITLVSCFQLSLAFHKAYEFTNGPSLNEIILHHNSLSSPPGGSITSSRLEKYQIFIITRLRGAIHRQTQFDFISTKRRLVNLGNRSMNFFDWLSFHEEDLCGPELIQVNTGDPYRPYPTYVRFSISDIFT
jgi:serine/threonine protein kinase